MPTPSERIQIYLELIHPKSATCAEISQALQMEPVEEVASWIERMSRQGTISERAENAQGEPLYAAFNHQAIEDVEHLLRRSARGPAPSWSPARSVAPPVSPAPKPPAAVPPVPSRADTRPASPSTPPPAPAAVTRPPAAPLYPSYNQFLQLAAQVLSQRYARPLSPAQIPGFPEPFPLVSQDRQVAGCALFLSRHLGANPPRPAEITERVWLLEKIPAQEKFIVFGGERDFPEMWLAKYGRLLRAVAFYFLTPPDELVPLNRSTSLDLPQS